MFKPLVSDKLWAIVEPFLPRSKVRNRHRQYAGRKPSDPRKVLTGIVFALRTGVPWEHLPATSEWPSGQTCLRYLRRWQRAGVWKKLFMELLGELARKGKIHGQRAIVDSASVRAPHGGRKTGPNPADSANVAASITSLSKPKGYRWTALICQVRPTALCNWTMFQTAMPAATPCSSRTPPEP